MVRGTTFIWGEGETAFALRLGEIEQLQQKTGVGPYQLFQRLQAGEWRQDDIRETLRLGLIGGGKKPDAAFKLIRFYVDERPLLENVAPATAVILAALVTPDGEKQPGGDEAGEATSESPSPTSTD